MIRTKAKATARLLVYANKIHACQSVAPTEQLLSKTNGNAKAFSTFVIKNSNASIPLQRNDSNSLYEENNNFNNSCRWTVSMCTGTGNRNKSKSGPRHIHKLPFLLGALFGFGKKDEENEKPENEDTLLWELKKAKYSEYKKDFKTALDQYHNALAILQDREREKEWDDTKVLEARTFIYDNLANLSMAMGLLDQSEKLFKETLKGYLQMGNPKFSNAAVEISLKLAMIYAMQKRFDEADQGYNFCIETMHTIINSRREQVQEKTNNVERETGKDDGMGPVDKDTLALLGMCYNSYSRFLYVTKQYEPAELMLKASLKLATQSLGMDHPQVVTIYNDLAAIATARGNLKDALEKSKRAVDLSRDLSPDDLPQMLCNLGNVHIRRKEVGSAKTHCKEALQMAKKSGDEHLQKAAKMCLEDAKSCADGKS